MAKKITSKKYKYYSLKIPLELKELFEKYITLKKALGYNNVNQYIRQLCQEEAKRILKEHPDLDNYIQVKKGLFVLRSKIQDYKDGKLDDINWSEFDK